MIVELLKDPPPPEKLPAGSERRRSRRHTVTLPAALQPEGAAAGDKFEVLVRDVSLHGAGLRCTSAMKVGATFVLDIGAGPLNLHARVRVASSRKRGETWDVGVEFY